MFITDLSIRRPVVSAVFSLLLILFGLFIFWKLPVRELPSGLQPPVVQVQVDYQSAAAPIIDQEITQIIEDVVGGAEGIRSIDSTSENGRSTIRIEFDTDIDLDSAANDVRDRVSRVVDNLPEDAKAPEILKQAAGFTTTMWISLSSSTWSDLELGDYARRYLVDSFSSVKDVGRILVGGLRELSIRVWIDPIKLAANDLTIQEVEQALRKENISLPAGTLEAENIDLTINLDKAYKDISSVKQLPIKKVKNSVVRLENIARIEFGPVSQKTLFKAQSIDGFNEKVVGIGIYARSGASTPFLKELLEKIGLDVTELYLYDVCAFRDTSQWNEFRQLFSQNKVDGIIFTSVSSVQAFFEIMQKDHDKNKLVDMLHETIVISIGPFTADELKKLNVENVIADVHTVPGSFDAIVKALSLAEAI